ncbi:MAG: Rne/Rng family ribonuclease [Bacteroidales bacterium]|nr:Rne/Rng family ribonuclease [Bacteroidales bacterium]
MEGEKDLIVDVAKDKVSVALMEEHRLVEFSEEACDRKTCSVGDVFLGRVKKLLPALNAAFVDIGDGKDAFVHYLDLGVNFYAFDEFAKRTNRNSDCGGIYSHIKFEKPLEKEGRIENVLSVGQSIIVQISKEPISTKGARLTCEISLAGRNIVLLPFADKVSVSQKIRSKQEKRRLELLVKNILPKNYGAIIRTAAEGKSASILDNELKTLVEKWENSWKKLARDKNVKLLFTECSKVTALLRDLLDETFTSIYVNDASEYDALKSYIALIAPGMEKIVKRYEGNKPIFDHFEVTRQIKGSFGKIVPIKQGAYLVIEHTEALHVVDVNSGTRAKNKEQEQNTFDINCYAAEEIARQMRLRDMGGIVIVDFIDMATGEHRNALYKKMQELMAGDRARHNILPLTKFGLMQITRQRVRPATEINTTEVCPVCHGTGKISSSVVIDEAIERKISAAAAAKPGAPLVLKLSPILGAYLKKGKGLFNVGSILSRWQKNYGCKITLNETSQFSVLQNELYDKAGARLDK